MRSPTGILGLFAAVGLGMGCASHPLAPITSVSSGQPVAPITDVPIEWEMLPAASSKPLQIEDTAIHGTLNDRDKKEIAALAGRVKGVYPKAHEVTAAFGDVIVAVQIKAGDREIYCVKDIYGKWIIVAVRRWWP